MADLFPLAKPAATHPAARRPRGGAARGLLIGGALLALAACSDPIDFDLRGLGNGFTTADAAKGATQDRPPADSRGVISYTGYQVAVARRGDTVAALAARVGLGAEELARYNGLKTGDVLRAGEVLALPRRVAEPAPGTIGGGGLAPEPVDVAAIAGSAIERADAPAGAPAPAIRPAGPEPVRHKVVRGETAYSVARLFNVSVRALSEWNGLGPDLAVREGQYLLIPVAAAPAPARPADAVEAPGAGSATPEPPSAKEPLPAEKAAPVTPKDVPASPDLAKSKTSASRLAMPVSGKIIREFAKGKSNGIDIAAPAGTPVVAAADGTVAVVTNDTSQVTIVVVRHSDNLLTVYAGMDGIKVAKGASVTRGQTLGVVRQGTPSFLHFEVAEGLERVDPVPFLN